MTKSQEVFTSKSKDELERWVAQKIQDRSRELLRYIDLLALVRLMPEQPAETDDDA